MHILLVANNENGIHIYERVEFSGLWNLNNSVE